MTLATPFVGEFTNLSSMPEASRSGSNPIRVRAILSAMLKGHLLWILSIFLARALFTPAVPVTGIVNVWVFLMIAIQGALCVAHSAMMRSTSAMKTSPVPASPFSSRTLDYYTYLCTFYFFLSTASCLSMIASVFRFATWYLKAPHVLLWLAQDPWDACTSWTFALFPFLLRPLGFPETALPLPSPAVLRSAAPWRPPSTRMRSRAPQRMSPAATGLPQGPANSLPAQPWPSLLLAALLYLGVLVAAGLLIAHGFNMYPTLVLGSAVCFCWLWLPLQYAHAVQGPMADAQIPYFVLEKTD